MAAVSLPSRVLGKNEEILAQFSVKKCIFGHIGGAVALPCLPDYACDGGR